MSNQKLESHMVSLEIAKLLKEAGWGKETEFCWALCADTSSTNFGGGEFRITTGGLPKETKVENYPAPLATEILEELPRGISISQYPKNDSLRYSVGHNAGKLALQNFRYNNNLCDALVEMWLYLKKENLL